MGVSGWVDMGMGMYVCKCECNCTAANHSLNCAFYLRRPENVACGCGWPFPHVLVISKRY